MDRRRFIPKSEGMETRMMLSTITPASALSGGLTPASGQILPITIKDKLYRIERLPGTLRTLSPNRFLPKDTMSEIQAGLTSMVSSLHPGLPACFRRTTTRCATSSAGLRCGRRTPAS